MPPHLQEKQVVQVSAGEATLRPSRKRDRSGDNLKKRWRTLTKTGDDLRNQYGARVYFSISVPRKHKDFVYRSSTDVTPILEYHFVWGTIISILSLLMMIKEKRYPPPIVVTGAVQGL
ncbi:hypothetical protein F5Y09DRAFT_226237 [Xylaria sp. FL1042]|nr:hypothetical protein F5Y09DRAFT_226237 [Xylaria sp. FL1042]